MNDESRPEAAPVNPAGRRVHDEDIAGSVRKGLALAVEALIERRIEPHQLPATLWDLWADGFHAGTAAAQPAIARERAAADYWYYVANNPAQIRAEHDALLRGFDVARSRKSARERWAELDRIAQLRAREARG